MARLWLLLAGINGFLAAAPGAFGTHGLVDVLDAQGMSNWMQAGQYQLFHAIAFVGVAWLSSRTPFFANVAGLFFLAGIVLFSGSLYLGDLTGLRAVQMAAPFGGGAFMLGWITIAVSSLRAPLQTA